MRDFANRWGSIILETHFNAPIFHVQLIQYAARLSVNYNSTLATTSDK